MTRPESRPPHSAALPTVERLLLGTLFLAAIVLLTFPAARDIGGAFGWTPFWLMALPATSLLAARLLAWARRDGVAENRAPALPVRRRRPAMAVARRRTMPRRPAARLLAAISLR
ncbi:hypothetical protein [Luteimonas saliphila]|uniref:hypothetical protein n=1 Tax=Luteimonas saliphila TaxID=2804919 RepID=UPI00192D2D0F|nr:hypothetical protein [Luteimonas saliphila]